MPLLVLPLMTFGRYTVRSIVAKRDWLGQVPYVYRMISAARGQEEPAQPVCSGALLFVCSLIVADQASMIAMALVA
ncbi:hypothetical protein GCM10022255_015400 [Dactylosporangium darangshiense]|uniref:Uncharacterized protein n=1 Tax=Dactylosporangium darangshiense TaxID=579108 RepID=A0ABP8D1E4_9ACTN